MYFSNNISANGVNKRKTSLKLVKYQRFVPYSILEDKQSHLKLDLLN